MGRWHAVSVWTMRMCLQALVYVSHCVQITDLHALGFVCTIPSKYGGVLCVFACTHSDAVQCRACEDTVYHVNKQSARFVLVCRVHVFACVLFISEHDWACEHDWRALVGWRQTRSWSLKNHIGCSGKVWSNVILWTLYEVLILENTLNLFVCTYCYFS